MSSEVYNKSEWGRAPHSLDSVYVIGSLRNPDIPQIANTIEDEVGIEAFDDWYSPGPEADDYWKKYSEAKGQTYEEALNDWAAQHVFEFDHHHLDRCDGAVLVFPAGRSCGIEFGYVTGRGKPGWVLLDSPDRWDVMVQFAAINGGGWAFNMDDLVAMIKEYKNGEH